MLATLHSGLAQRTKHLDSGTKILESRLSEKIPAIKMISGVTNKKAATSNMQKAAETPLCVSEVST